jgi:hypothetical protein
MQYRSDAQVEVMLNPMKRNHLPIVGNVNPWYGYGFLMGHQIAIHTHTHMYVPIPMTHTGQPNPYYTLGGQDFRAKVQKMMKASAKAMELPSTSQTLKHGCNEDSMHSQPERKQPMKCLCATLPGLQSYDAQALKDGCLTPSTISLQIFIGTFYIKSVSTSACCLS